MQTTRKALVTAISIIVFCGPAFAIDFSNYPSYAEASVRLGVRHWTTGVPDYDDNDVFGQYDFKSGTNPSASASGSGSPAPVYNPGTPIGTFSGSAAASAQSLKASISTPSTPSDWTPTSADYTLGQSATASFYDWMYYDGSQTPAEKAQLTMHYDVTGTINFSNNSFNGDRPQTLVEMRQLNPVGNFMDYYEIFSSHLPSTWIGGDFYSYHSFNIGFDFIIDVEIDAINEMVSQFQIYTEFEVPGAPGVAMDFSNTASYYVKDLRELTIDGENRILGSELPLIDPSTGALLLESASGTNYAVPIPGAVWLLGSALIGLFGFRKKFKK